MKFISWNVNGFRACLNKGFEDFFKNEDADFFCIQETKMQEGQMELSKEGYVFGGWYKDEGFKHQAIPGSVILSDTTLYAKWQKLYSVSFDNNEIGNDVNNAMLKTYGFKYLIKGVNDAYSTEKYGQITINIK